MLQHFSGFISKFFICSTKGFYIRIGSNSLLDAREELETNSPISGWGFYFIGVVITMLVVGFVSRYTIDGAGIAGLLVLWGFTLLNPDTAVACVGGLGGACFTPLIATTLTTVVTGAALYLRQQM